MRDEKLTSVFAGRNEADPVMEYDEVITAKDVGITGDKMVQIPLNTEQRHALLNVLIESPRRYKCLQDLVTCLANHVKKDDPENYSKLCVKAFIMKHCELTC